MPNIFPRREWGAGSSGAGEAEEAGGEKFEQTANNKQINALEKRQFGGIFDIYPLDAVRVLGNLAFLDYESVLA